MLAIDLYQIFRIQILVILLDLVAECRVIVSDGKDHGTLIYESALGYKGVACVSVDRNVSVAVVDGDDIAEFHVGGDGKYLA